METKTNGAIRLQNPLSLTKFWNSLPVTRPQRELCTGVKMNRSVSGGTTRYNAQQIGSARWTTSYE